MADLFEVKLSEVFPIREYDELNTKQMPWKWDNDVWWLDSRILYTSVEIGELDDVQKDGVKASDGTLGKGAYLSVDPFTARDELNLGLKDVPREERAVLAVRLKDEDVADLIFTVDDGKLLLDRQSWRQGDETYWRGVEVMYPRDLPPSRIIGYMVKA